MMTRNTADNSRDIAVLQEMVHRLSLDIRDHITDESSWQAIKDKRDDAESTSLHSRFTQIDDRLSTLEMDDRVRKILWRVVAAVVGTTAMAIGLWKGIQSLLDIYTTPPPGH